VQLKKVASTHGGEWVGPCPACGGRDRFHVWPDKVDSKRSDRVGIYWCRSCEKAGDVVQWFVDFEGKSYREAFQALGLDMPEDYRHPYAAPQAPRPPACTSKNDVQAPQPAPQSEKWLEKASALVDFAEKALQESDFALKWLKKRGITRKIAKNMRLGWLSEDHFRPRESWGLDPVLKEDGKPKKLWLPAGLVIPLLAPDGRPRRLRIRRFSEREPRYYVVPGSLMQCMAHGLPARAAVIVESELDAILLAGVAADLAAVVALGSSTAKPGAELARALADCAVVLVALDSDRAGAEAMAWWREHLPRSRRWPVPQGKDPGEAYAAGVDIREWVLAGLPRGWFLGPSPIGLTAGRAAEAVPAESGKAATTEGGSAHTADDQAAPGAGEAEGPAPTISEVEELSGLLRRHPVEIRVAADGSRVHIREKQSWRAANWEISKRISQLVFMPEVLEHLWGLGVEVINGRNFDGIR
jgi:hypothetical protein